jgi:hypothetical protein
VSSSSREAHTSVVTRSMSVAFLVAAAALLASGCGGSGGGKYSLSATQQCLNGIKGLHAIPQQNRFLAASGGNLKITFGYGTPVVYLVFGKNTSEAKKLEERGVAQAERYQAIPRKVILDGVAQKANVFYYSDEGALTQVARAKVEACLR